MEKSAMKEFKEAILNVITERLKQDVELDDYDEGYIDALRFIVTDIDLQYIAKEREQIESSFDKGFSRASKNFRGEVIHSEANNGKDYYDITYGGTDEK